MIKYGAIILLLAIVPFVTDSAFAQTIQLNETTPCFLNYNTTNGGGYKMWETCNAKDDYLTFALQPWEYATGGYFSLMVVGVLILASYIKYHKTVYPLMIGTVFLPISYALFPDTFFLFLFPFVGFAIAILVYKSFIRQTEPGA